METQISKLRKFMANDDWYQALRLAAKWANLGGHKAEIERGWAALTNPQFYRDIGKDPDELVRQGISALKERYAK